MGRPKTESSRQYAAGSMQKAADQKQKAVGSMQQAVSRRQKTVGSRQQAESSLTKGALKEIKDSIDWENER